MALIDVTDPVERASALALFADTTATGPTLHDVSDPEEQRQAMALFKSKVETEDGTYRILDGDTVEEKSTGRRLRLAGINTSETGRGSHDAATLELKRVLDANPGRTVKTAGKDAHGREIAEFFDGSGQSINRFMVESGFAASFDKGGQPGPHRDAATAASFRAQGFGQNTSPEIAAAEARNLDALRNSAGLKYDDLKPGRRALTLKQELGEGARRGTDQLQGALYGAIDALGSATGSETLSKIGREGYLENEKEAAAHPATIKGIEHIKNVSDFAHWAAGAGGEVLPSVGVGIATGGTGALAARALTATTALATARTQAVEKLVASGIARGLAERAVARGVSSKAVGQAMAHAMNTATKVGAGAGLWAGSALQEGGGSFEEMRDAGINAPGTAAVVGAVAGGLDALPALRIFTRVFPGVDKSVGQAAVSRVLKAFGLDQAFIEGSTEAAQELVAIAGRAYNDPNYKINTTENRMRLINAAAAGALVGTVGGAGSAFLSREQPTSITPPASTNVPPASTNVPPASTNVPPASTNVPPASTNVPPASTNVPPASTNAPSVDTFLQPGAAVDTTPAFDPEVPLVGAQVRPGTAPAAFPTWDTLQRGQQVTLYRGESPENTKGGNWWTTDKAKAALYAKNGQMHEVTLLAEDISKHAAQGHGGKDEFFFPSGLPAAKSTPAFDPEVPPIGAPFKTVQEAHVATGENANERMREQAAEDVGLDAATDRARDELGLPPLDELDDHVATGENANERMREQAAEDVGTDIRDPEPHPALPEGAPSDTAVAGGILDTIRQYADKTSTTATRKALKRLRAVLAGTPADRRQAYENYAIPGLQENVDYHREEAREKRRQPKSETKEPAVTNGISDPEVRAQLLAFMDEDRGDEATPAPQMAKRMRQYLESWLEAEGLAGSDPTKDRGVRRKLLDHLHAMRSSDADLDHDEAQRAIAFLESTLSDKAPDLDATENEESDQADSTDGTDQGVEVTEPTVILHGMKSKGKNPKWTTWFAKEGGADETAPWKTRNMAIYPDGHPEAGKRVVQDNAIEMKLAALKARARVDGSGATFDIIPHKGGEVIRELNVSKTETYTSRVDGRTYTQEAYIAHMVQHAKNVAHRQLKSSTDFAKRNILLSEGGKPRFFSARVITHLGMDLNRAENTVSTNAALRITNGFATGMRALAEMPVPIMMESKTQHAAVSSKTQIPLRHRERQVLHAMNPETEFDIKDTVVFASRDKEWSLNDLQYRLRLPDQKLEGIGNSIERSEKAIAKLRTKLEEPGTKARKEVLTGQLAAEEHKLASMQNTRQGLTDLIEAEAISGADGARYDDNGNLVNYAEGTITPESSEFLPEYAEGAVREEHLDAEGKFQFRKDEDGEYVVDEAGKTDYEAIGQERALSDESPIEDVKAIEDEARRQRREDMNEDYTSKAVRNRAFPGPAQRRRAEREVAKSKAATVVEKKMNVTIRGQSVPMTEAEVNADNYADDASDKASRQEKGLPPRTKEERRAYVKARSLSRKESGKPSIHQREADFVKDMLEHFGLNVDVDLIDQRAIESMPAEEKAKYEQTLKDATHRKGRDPLKGRVFAGGGKATIFISDKVTSPKMRFAIIAHELGHIAGFALFDALPAKHPARTRLLAAHKADMADPSIATNRDFNEWLANQFVGYALRRVPPSGIVEAFFQKMQYVIGLIYERMQERYSLNETYEQFLDEMVDLTKSGGIRRMSLHREVMEQNFTMPSYISNSRAAQYSARVAKTAGGALKHIGLEWIAPVQTWLRNQKDQFGNTIEEATILANIYNRIPGEKINDDMAAKDYLGNPVRYGVLEDRLGRMGPFMALAQRIDEMLTAPNRRLPRAARKAANEAASAQALQDLYAGRVTPVTTAVRKLLADMHGYLKQAMPELGHITNYIPRVYDVLALQQRAQDFIDMLVRNGVQANDAVEIHAKLADNSGYTVALSPLERNPAFSAGKQRGLDSIPDSELAPFLTKDMGGLLLGYIKSGVKRAESDRRYGRYELDKDGNRAVDANGKEIWNPTKAFDDLKRAADAKMTPPQRAKFHKNLAALRGELGADFDPKLRHWMSYMMVYQNYRTLPFSLLASFPDLGGIIVGARGFSAAWHGMVEGLRSTIAAAKGNRDVLHELAEFMGIISESVDMESLNEATSSNFVTPDAKRANDLLFKYNLLQSFTRMTRVMALSAGKKFLETEAAKPVNARSTRYLEELGLTRDEALNALDANGQLVWDKSLAATDPATMKIASALNQFVNRSVLRPNAAHRTSWMSDPRFMLIAHLKSFMYSFNEVILRGAYNEAKNRKGEGLLSQAAVPALALATLLPLALAGLAIRDLLQYALWGETSKRDVTDIFELLQRSGGLGYGQLAVDVYEAEGRGRMSVLALGGPTVSWVESLATGRKGEDWGDAAWRRLTEATPLVASLPGLRKVLQDAVR